MSSHRFTAPTWSLFRMVVGALVLAGFATRPAAIVAAGSMAYAYVVVHQPHAVLPIQNGGVTPALYAWTFLAIAVAGAGPWSKDVLIARHRAVTATVKDGREVQTSHL